MKKTTQSEYLAALEEANQCIEDDCQDDNEPGYESEAERMAASLPPKKIKNINKPLTEQQRAFATYVIQGKTRREAYRLAYNTQMSDSAVSSNAAKLAADPRIAAMISAAWDETIEHLADDVASTRRYVLRKLVSLSKEGKQEGSRLKALELLGKTAGLFVQQAEQSEKVVAADQLKRELSQHLKLLDNVKTLKIK
jgi:phage terminase small subunit